MKNIRIINDDMDHKEDEKSELYINIFWEEPWNEGYKCTTCEKLFSLSEVINNNLKQCFCSGNLKKIYDNEQIKKERRYQANKQWYIWRLAETLENKLIWFMSWWVDDIITVNTEKLLLLEDQLSVVKQETEKIYPDFNFDNTFYAAEMVIDQARRGQWIASKLFNKVLEEANKNWYNSTILSTTTKEWWPFKRFEILWYKIVFRYNDENDRVIMVKKILGT